MWGGSCFGPAPEMGGKMKKGLIAGLILGFAVLLAIGWANVETFNHAVVSKSLRVTGPATLAKTLAVTGISTLTGTATFGTGAGTIADVAGTMTITEDTVALSGMLKLGDVIESVTEDGDSVCVIVVGGTTYKIRP